MTPGIADGLALTYYMLFWGAIFWMIDFNLTFVLHIFTFNPVLIIVAAGGFSYLTVWASNRGSV